MGRHSDSDLEDINARTMVFLQTRVTATEPPGFEEAFRLLHAHLELPGTGIDTPNRLFVGALDIDRSLATCATILNDTTLTIGRHTGCDFRLPSLRVSLRHIVVHFWSEPGEETRIRLWDLNTGQPFQTEEGEPAMALVAEGPLYIRLGGYAIVFLPLLMPSGEPWPTNASEAWTAMPERALIDKRSAAEDKDGEKMGSKVFNAAWETRESDASISRITLVNAPLTLVDSPLARYEPLLDEVSWAELTISQKGHRLRQALSSEHADRGILVGRYDRCEIKVAEDNAISRVHLLIVRIDFNVWAIDTASSNGSRMGGKRCKAAILGERERIRIGHSTVVNWRRICMGEA